MNTKETILLVDDEEIVRSSLEAILEREGYEVLAVESGEKAMEALQEKEFSLILADLVMEDIDGLTILEEVKAKTPDTVVIMITGHASMDSALSAMRLGAYNYLIKPCNLNELTLAVSRGLERRRLQLELRARTEALTRKVEQMAVLHGLTTKLLQPLNQDELSTLIIRGILESLGFKRVFVGLTDEGKDRIKGYMLDGEELRAEAISLQELVQFMEQGKRVGRCYRPRAKQAGPLGLSLHGLLVPLGSNGEGILGAILVDSPHVEAPPSSETAQMLETLANTAVAAIKRLKLQQQLVQAERLKAITETAITVNHEINNPLTSILLSAQIALKNKELDADTMEKLKIIENNSVRIKRITEKLTRLIRPMSVPYAGGVRMIDITGSASES